MAHRPILIRHVAFHLPQKVCFADFTTQVHDGARIGVIGRNGSGKSTLLTLLQGNKEPSQGTIHIPDEVVFGYVPQVIDDY
jgi:ATPase subunit of ABC transporter with duplicated ATPase domains